MADLQQQSHRVDQRPSMNPVTAGAGDEISRNPLHQSTPNQAPPVDAGGGVHGLARTPLAMQLGQQESERPVGAGLTTCASIEDFQLYNRMDTIVLQLEAALDKDGTLPVDVVTALSLGVDMAWERRREESNNLAIVSALVMTMAVPVLCEPPGGDNVNLDVTAHYVLDSASVCFMIVSVVMFIGNILFAITYLSTWNRQFSCDADWYAYHMTMDFDALVFKYSGALPFTIGGVGFVGGLICRVPFVYMENVAAQVIIFSWCAIGAIWIFFWNFPVLSKCGIDCSPWGARAFKKLWSKQGKDVAADTKLLIQLLRKRVEAHAAGEGHETE